jgi:hypothetical protein
VVNTSSNAGDDDKFKLSVTTKYQLSRTPAVVNIRRKRRDCNITVTPASCVIQTLKNTKLLQFLFTNILSNPVLQIAVFAAM